MVKRIGLFLAPVLIFLSSFCSHNEQANKGWISLFNGKNLDGWTVKCLDSDRGKDFWHVTDGKIACNSIGFKDHDYVWLMTDKEFSDFELRLKFQAFRDSPGNSGVQVRSRYDASPDAPHGGWLDGPQIDIHPPGPWRTGLIYDETREERRWISPSLENSKIDVSYAPEQVDFTYADEINGWNELHIICEKTSIKTILNGNTVSDYDGSGVLDNEAHVKHNVGMNGHIALQLHIHDEVKIQFKDIKIREIY